MTGVHVGEQKAKSQAERERWLPHEAVLVAHGAVWTLDDSDSPWPALTADSTRIGLTLAAAAVLAFWWLARVGAFRFTPAARSAVVPLALFTAYLAATTFTRDLPSDRYQLFLQLLLVVGGFLICEGTRAGSWVDICYRIGVVHLLLAVADGRTQPVYEGMERLAGITHPVLLGFEASLVLIVGAARYRHRIGRWPRLSLAVAVFAGYVLYATFSRTALISVTVAVVLALALRQGRGRAVRFVTIVGAAGVVGVLFYQRAVDFLVGPDPAALETGSGRYNIWAAILDRSWEWWTFGYGFQALRDGTGPDRMTYLAAYGLPAENAPLQVALMGGVGALALWLWLAWRAARAALGGYRAASVLTVALLVVLLFNAVYSVGLSGASTDFRWLLAAFSWPTLLLASQRETADHVRGTGRPRRGSTATRAARR